MRFIRSKRSFYVVQGLPFHKGFEMGVNLDFQSDGGFDARWSFRTRGDHAGFMFCITAGKFLFEVNLVDSRHWSYKLGRFLEHGEVDPDPNPYHDIAN